MDLSDLIADQGEDAAERLLRAAPAALIAPTPLEGSASRVRQLVERAVEDATAGALVFVQVPPGVGKTYHAERIADAVATGAHWIPVHGRRPAGHVGAWPPETRRVVLAFSSHQLCEEKARELDEAGGSAPVVHLAGMLQSCAFADKVRTLFPTVGRRGICGEEGSEERCDYAETCPGARGGSVDWGEVAVAPHAMAPSLRADLAILDESPATLSLDSVEDAEVRTLICGSTTPRARYWRRRNPEGPTAASALCEIFGSAAAGHRRACESGTRAPYARRVSGEELGAMVRDAAVAMVDLMGEAFGKGAPLPPPPSPSQARSGWHIGSQMPSRAAAKAMRSLHRWLAAGGEVEAFEGDPVWPSVVLRPDGSWALEVRRVAALPKCPTVVLDATARHSVDEWRAAYPDRRVVVHSLDVAGTAPARATSFRTNALTRSRILLDGEVSGSGRTVVQEALGAAVREVKRSRPLAASSSDELPIAVLTHRPVAPLVEAAQFEGVQLLVGYYGKDDRGTNAFRDVAGIVLLGDPTENLGAVGADAAALGLDAEEVARNRTAATLEQAIARARHIRRHGSDRTVLVHVGHAAPAVPGVAWEVQRLAISAPPAARLSDAVDVAHWLAVREGVVGEDVIRRADLDQTPWAVLAVRDAPPFILSRASAMVAERLGFHGARVRLGGREVLVYERSPGIGAEWADWER